MKRKNKSELELKKKMGMGLSSMSLNKLWGLFNPKKKYNITMVGLDGAGKTSILLKLKKIENEKTVPTIGFNVETIVLSENVSMSIIDVGGQDVLRDLWRHYYEGADAVIFVVDSNDTKRFLDAKKELMEFVMKEEALKNAILLVFANKQDIDQAASVITVAENLGLQDLTKQNRKWFIQGSCATTGEGLWAGVAWLAAQLDNR